LLLFLFHLYTIRLCNKLGCVMHGVQKNSHCGGVGIAECVRRYGGIHITAQPKPLSQLSLSVGLVPLTAPNGPKPQAHWWQVWGDAQLDGLMAEALAHNPTLALAAARTREAAGLAEVAGAALRPRVDFNSKLSGMHWANNALAPPTLGGANTWFNFTNLSASTALDIWGQNRARATAAERIMQRAGLDSAKPSDLFKIKSKNKGKPEPEAQHVAYGALVVTQQRAGLYSMPCAAGALA
jgi:hypothetical protein